MAMNEILVLNEGVPDTEHGQLAGSEEMFVL